MRWGSNALWTRENWLLALTIQIRRPEALRFKLLEKAWSLFEFGVQPSNENELFIFRVKLCFIDAPLGDCMEMVVSMDMDRVHA